ncbi:MAG: hypothetical protein J0H74_04180 [Chitinophagaceae bacterium]|nr:hypothetical protein [Chitinophagaceae bacterium]
MRYGEFEVLISPQRLNRYKSACTNNTRKTLSLYRANIRMSQAFLAVLGIFEVVLRNKIDLHYKAQFSVSPDWLLASTLPKGFLTRNGCQNSVNKISRTYADLGPNYTHDKLLSELSFGFWKFMFAGRQFQAGGSTLLAIFPSLPARRNQSFIYHKLDRINSIRNRVAHHEPICFGIGNTIGTAYARSHFQEIIDIITYMGINSQQLFYGIDGVIKEADFIDGI